MRTIGRRRTEHLEGIAQLGRSLRPGFRLALQFVGTRWGEEHCARDLQGPARVAEQAGERLLGTQRLRIEGERLQRGLSDACQARCRSTVSALSS